MKAVTDCLALSLKIYKNNGVAPIVKDWVILDIVINQELPDNMGDKRNIMGIL